MSIERAVPFDVQSERATLGAILLERDAIIAVASWLLPAHFYLEKHDIIYAAMLGCYNRREPPDLATIAAELRRREKLDLIGGSTYLGELITEVPTAVHIEYYAKTVERTALLRQLIEAGGRIAAIGYNEADAESLEDVLGLAEAELRRVSQQRRDQGYVAIGQVVNEVFTRIESIQQRRDEVIGVPTGYPDLDALTGGFQPSDLIIIGGRPSQGKTALALSLAYNVAHVTALGVGVFSLEMSRDQLVQRILSMHTDIDLKRLRMGNLPDAELTRAFEGMGVLSRMPLFIDDTPGVSIGELRARARRMCAEQDISLLIVDYLQLMSGGRRAENRVQEVSEISRGLKQLARELKMPVIALSQLSRDVEKRNSHIPLLSDLRDSGSIEQDCDIALGIYREETYDKNTDRKGVAEVHVLKHRNGPLGVIPMRFEGRTTRFQSMERYRVPTGY